MPSDESILSVGVKEGGKMCRLTRPCTFEDRQRPSRNIWINTDSKSWVLGIHHGLVPPEDHFTFGTCKMVIF